MASFTNLGERLTLQQALQGAHIALYTAAPGEDGGGTEVTGGGYARQPLGASAPATATDGTTSSSNSNTITFPTATAAWGTIAALGVTSAATAGDLKLFYVIPEAERKAIGNGDQYFIDAGKFTVSLD